MSMDDKDDKYLEDLLAMTREDEPPPWLQGRIMARLDDHRPKAHRRLTGWLMRNYTFSFRPLPLAASIAVVMLAFWGGMQIERSVNMSSPAQPHLVPAVAVENAKASYLIGRGLLAGNQVQQALPYLKKAVELNPGSAEYSHWQGVAYWAAGNTDLERRSYVRSIQDNPDYLPSLLYLGHNYLDSGDYKAALKSYQRVLQKDPNVPEALYNKGLAYQKLNEKPLEVMAFKEYLEAYRTGKWANRAVKHLHELGDYNYRSYRIGVQRIVLNMSDLLEPGHTEQKNKEMNYLARVLGQVSNQELHIVAYNQQYRQKAKDIAFELRRQLLDYLGPQKDIIVRVSWFDTAETISAQNGPGEEISPSLLLFTRQTNSDNRRNAI